jgi:hypothetical protein
MKIDKTTKKFAIFFSLCICGCTQKPTIFNSNYILEKRIAFELDRAYEKRLGFFDVKVQEFEIIEKKDNLTICSADISFKIADGYLGEYKQLTKYGQNIGLVFENMDNFKPLKYKQSNAQFPSNKFFFLIKKDRKKSGFFIEFVYPLCLLPHYKLFNPNLFRDFINLNRPLFDSSVADISSKKLDLPRVTAYLKDNGFIYNSTINTYVNENSSLQILKNQNKTELIINSPNVLRFRYYNNGFLKKDDFSDTSPVILKFLDSPKN